MNDDQFNHPPVASVHEQLALQQIIGKSEALVAVLRRIPLMSRCAAAVLISGETGTGKEICARAIHYLGPRADHPFVAVNCGAIPVDLLENELFGHERGAFTTADSRQTGLLSEADRGTLFLDEVDALPLSAQVKILRFLQDKEFRPLGAGKPRHADVRVIAATNLALPESIRAGKFRQDLYYRLNVLPLALPPLRERREDIPLLAQHFLKKLASESATSVRNLSAAALQKLICYDWPGNVRELENVIERAVLLSEHADITSEDVLQESDKRPALESFRTLKSRAIEQFERRYLQDLLTASGGNITKAAQAAQKNRRAFYELMRKHRISVHP